MSKEPPVHYWARDDARTACGLTVREHAVEGTTTPRAVTCRSCKRSLRRGRVKTGRARSTAPVLIKLSGRWVPAH